MGARPLRRTIQDHIEDAITDFYLENPNEKDLKAVMTSKGHITIKSAKKPKKLLRKLRQQKKLIKQRNQVAMTWFLYLSFPIFKFIPNSA